MYFDWKLNSLLVLPLAGLAVTSCQDYSPIADEAAFANLSVKEEYTENFVKRYGDIDPNHTWGFGNLEAVNYSNTTRADQPESYGAGVVNVQRNMWTETDNNGYKESALARTVKIPGWPNFDGKYYTVNSGNVYNSIESAQPTEMSKYQAAGDVTDYEIQYVSEWFRTNRNPTSIELHLTDFFVQNISADNDRTTYPSGELINNVLGEPCTFEMDHIIFAGIESTKYPYINETWTHLNNYNSGNTNKIHYYEQVEDGFEKDSEGKETETVKYKTIQKDDIISDGWKTKSGWYCNNKLHNREIKYVTSAGTEDFAYTESFGLSAGDQGTYHDNWVLVRLEWDEVGYDNKTYHREGYYLAFDYTTQKNGNTYPADGYYSNWIVKITPAYDSEEHNSPRRRVMCEDLGNTFDFDFNDVVFDVDYEVNKNDGSKKDAVITLQASGGTLPIFVGKDPSVVEGAYEAHKLLANSSSTPVNVGGVQHEIAIYRIEGVSSTNPNDLPIYVQTSGNSATNEITLLPTTGKGSKLAPQKFLVPNTSTRWLKESQQIEWGYELFDEWVSDNASFSDSIDEWGNVTAAKTTPWYAPTKDELWKNGKKYTETVHANYLY